jgi:biopolymer transport protein ExbB
MNDIVSGQKFWDMFLKGGPLMWPILFCSIATLAFMLERFITLRRGAVFPGKLFKQVQDLIARGRFDDATDVCRRNRSPFARLLYACLMRSDMAGFEMEAALEETGARILYDLRRPGIALGVVADVSPLLGLMGTVLGMIKAFEVVARTGALGRTELLAEGISEALLTTAFGLSVAIPALILYSYFRGKADGLLRTMEDACIELLEEIRRGRKES